MKRLCAAGCGTSLEKRHPSARWCSPRCKKRGQRAPSLVVLPAGDKTGDTAGDAEPALVAATRADLVAAERLATPLGESAMTLARGIAAGQHSGAALAALVREFRATLAEAMRGADRVESDLDRMRRVVLERLSRGA